MGKLGLRSIGRLADDEVTRRLTTVWGIGAWTTQMFLIFKLGRPDVMPAGDLGVHEGLRILDGLESVPRRSASWLAPKCGVHFGASPRGFSGVSRISDRLISAC